MTCAPTRPISAGLIRRIAFALLIFFIFQFIQTVAAKEETTLRVGIFANTPLSFLDDQGVAQGIYPDILREIAKLEDWNLEFVLDSWSGSLERLRSGDIDLMISIVYSEERDKIFDFSKEPAVTAWGQIFVGDNRGIKSILDLSGKKIAVMKKDINARNFMELCRKFSIKAEFIETAIYDDVCKLILSGKVDAGVINNINGAFLMKNNKIHPTPIMFSPVSAVFAVAEGKNPDLLKDIDTHLATWRSNKSSVYFDILNRWFGDNAGHPQIPYKLIAVVIAAAAGISIFLFVWMGLLRLQVRARTKELADSEERFRQLAEHINEAFYIMSPDLKEFSYISPAFERIWGRPCESLFADSEILVRAIYSDDLELVMECFNQEITPATTEIRIPEHRIVRPDGSIRWILNRGFPVFDKAGKLLRIVGIAVDITAHKQAEKTFQTIVESTSGFIGQDLFDNIVGELSVWLGCDIAILGEIADNSTFKTLSMKVDDEHRKNFACKLAGSPCQTVVKQGFTVYPEKVSELFPDNKSLVDLGASGYVGTPLIDRNNKPVGVLCALSRHKLNLPRRTEEVMRTIAARATVEIERKRMDEEKKLIEDQLRQAQKMEAIGTLAGGIAHDFNNILGAIIGYSEMIEMYAKLKDETVMHNLKEVLRAAYRAKDLVQQILTFSRQSEQKKMAILVAPIVKEALKLIRSSLPTTIDIHQNINADSGSIMADPTQIHQIVMNLCTNAGHAMREHGGILEVEVDSVHLGDGDNTLHPDLLPGDYLELTVSDTGRGMTDPVMERIFEPYFTTKMKGEGTGMGLAVVHGIVKGHGGAIRVESEIGNGSIFKVYLPLTAREVHPEKGADLEFPGGSERILFVDDEAALVEVGRQMLQHLGYDAVCRTSSIEALEAFRAAPEKFDLIITDMTMPNVTGDQLAKEVSDIRPDIPIILCTGFSEQMNNDKARAAGVSGLLLKPLTIQGLAAAVREALDEKKG